MTIFQQSSTLIWRLPECVRSHPGIIATLNFQLFKGATSQIIVIYITWPGPFPSDEATVNCLPFFLSTWRQSCNTSNQHEMVQVLGTIRLGLRYSPLTVINATIFIGSDEGVTCGIVHHFTGGNPCLNPGDNPRRETSVHHFPGGNPFLNPGGNPRRENVSPPLLGVRP